MTKIFLGELIGTFILVFIGCGIVGLSLFHETITLLEIALIWGLGVFLGILSSRRYCYAHLNPAVSLAFLILGEIKVKVFLKSAAGQFSGAILAGLALFGLFSGSLSTLEDTNGWERAESSGLNTAKMFGEFYDPETTPLLEGLSMELFGTLILVLMILIYSRDAGKTQCFPLYLFR